MTGPFCASCPRYRPIDLRGKKVTLREMKAAEALCEMLKIENECEHERKTVTQIPVSRRADGRK